MNDNNEINILNTTDAAIFKAIAVRVDTQIDWEEIIQNYFIVNKSVIWYNLLNDSVRRFVAAGFLNYRDSKLSKNQKLAIEFFDISLGTHAEFTRNEQLFDKYPIDIRLLYDLPEYIISVQEFEDAMARFYEFIGKEMPEQLAPRRIAKNLLLIEGTSTDPTYGTTIENPINVGGFLSGGTAYIRLYFNSLLGENGNPITYRRIGPCLEVEVPIGRSEGSVVDMYAVQIEGEPKGIGIYINMYDCRLPLKAPMGFAGKMLGRMG